MGFNIGLAQRQGMQYPGGQYGGGFDTSRFLKGGITGAEILPGLQGQTPRSGPVYPSGQSPNAGQQYDPYGSNPPNYPGPRGPQGPAGPPGLPGPTGQSFSSGQDWMYGAPNMPVGNLSNIGIPLEDQIAIQSVGNRIHSWQGGGYEQSPTKPGVVYTSQRDIYDNSGVPITTGYPGLGMSGVVARDTGVRGPTGGGGSAGPGGYASGWTDRIQGRPEFGQVQNPGMPAQPQTTANPYQGIVDMLAALTPAPMPAFNAGSFNLPQVETPSLANAFKSVSGGYFGRSSTNKGATKQTFLGTGSSGTGASFLGSASGGGFFGTGGTPTKKGRNALLG